MVRSKLIFQTIETLFEDCQVAYVVMVGGPAAAKIILARVYLIKKLMDGGEASEIIDQLQGVTRGFPPPWLAKHLSDDAEKRVRFGRSDKELAS